MTIRDSNGKSVTRQIRRESNGWSSNVWAGGANGLATTIRRYTYETRRQAMESDISDEIGQRGRIAATRPGRPRVLVSARECRVSLEAEHIERAKELGDGNISAGVRKALS